MLEVERDTLSDLLNEPTIHLPLLDDSKRRTFRNYEGISDGVLLTEAEERCETNLKYLEDKLLKIQEDIKNLKKFRLGRRIFNRDIHKIKDDLLREVVYGTMNSDYKLAIRSYKETIPRYFADVKHWNKLLVKARLRNKKLEELKTKIKLKD